ncbi:Legume lectin, alpha chain, conserved site [Sesbania bispinosa]|nr:Legume lectin, alpha chain, conserved site [Sesbania bispinosa]
MGINISSPPSLVSLLVIIVSFLILVHNVEPASFNFPTFGPYTNDITFQGDAFASNGVLQLTKLGNGSAPLPNSAGRASYAGPVRLWDAKRGELAGFTTTFSFVVAPTSLGLFGDGISFFIAPFNSYIPQNSSGGFLGLFSAESALNAYQNQIVAVEFDSFGNPWDPVSSHIGIDINSIVSATTVPWQNGNLVSQITAFATVSYEPVTKNLSVMVSYPQSQVNQNVSSSSLSFVVDLRTVLPQWVRVGFSGATGQLVEVHKILSWSFNSSFS